MNNNNQFENVVNNVIDVLRKHNVNIQDAAQVLDLVRMAIGRTLVNPVNPAG